MSAAVPDDAVEDGVDRDERDRPDHGPEQPRRTHLSSPAHLAELAHDQRTRRGEARADDDRDDAVLDPSENVVDVRLDTGRRRRTHVADTLRLDVARDRHHLGGDLGDGVDDHLTLPSSFQVRFAFSGPVMVAVSYTHLTLPTIYSV